MKALIYFIVLLVLSSCKPLVIGDTIHNNTTAKSHYTSHDILYTWVQPTVDGMDTHYVYQSEIIIAEWNAEPIYLELNSNYLNRDDKPNTKLDTVFINYTTKAQHTPNLNYQAFDSASFHQQISSIALNTSGLQSIGINGPFKILKQPKWVMKVESKQKCHLQEPILYTQCSQTFDEVNLQDLSYCPDFNSKNSLYYQDIYSINYLYWNTYNAEKNSHWLIETTNAYGIKDTLEFNIDLKESPC